MSIELPKESFLALAAVAWADGRMRKEEASGLRRAAEVSGLAGDDLEAVTEATEHAVGLDDVAVDGLDEPQAVMTYAFANWLAVLDGVVNAQEVRSLRDLGDRLGLPAQKLAVCRSAAHDIAVLPGGDRPEKYDFAALEQRLRERLPGTFGG